MVGRHGTVSGRRWLLWLRVPGSAICAVGPVPARRLPLP